MNRIYHIYDILHNCRCVDCSTIVIAKTRKRAFEIARVSRRFYGIKQLGFSPLEEGELDG